MMVSKWEEVPASGELTLSDTLCLHTATRTCCPEAVPKGDLKKYFSSET